jgi:hypothetical protein
MATIQDEIRDILRAEGRDFLTAYQILNRLPVATRDALFAQHGERSGKGAGRPVTPARAVADALGTMDDVQRERLNTADLAFTIAGVEVEAGAATCGLYRLRI